MAIDTSEINILMMPDYRLDNPYQTLLSEALNKENISILFPQGYRRIFPIFRQVQSSFLKIQVLHLHWLNPYLKGENLFGKLIYGLKFLLDISLVKIQGIKIIWTIHNLLSHNSKSPRLEKYIKQQFSKLVDHVIVHSQSAKEAVIDTYQINADKITVIPHGHYRDVYAPAITKIEARKQLDLPLEGLIFLNFGMLRPYKGIEKLLEIWHSCPEAIAGHQLMIVGKALDESYASELDQKAKNIKEVELRDQFVPNEKIHLYFSAADVIVLPFNQILTSGSLLLAMSYGKPIISPCLANIQETLENATDFLYNPENPNGLVEAIQASIKGDLIQASQKVVAAGDRLSWDSIAQQTKQLYLS